MTKENITIGIEVHLQLNSKAKLFSQCSNSCSEYSNKNTDFLNSGQIGWYPILNQECVKKASVFSLALDADISKCSSFFRKCYMYHDNPKNYQITQEKNPISKNGNVLILSDGKIKKIGIDRVQLEEDTAITKNYGKISGINLNRAGSPLIEVITKPCIHSIKDAIKTCKELRNLAIDNNVSTCSLEEGEIRFDCNVSINNKDGSLGTRYEIKNLNSFLNIEKALSSAISQQRKLIDDNKPIQQSTFKWDGEKKVLVPLREKTSDFYGFLPDVDIPAVIIENSYITELRKEVSENPCERVFNFMKDFSLDEDEARTASEDVKLEKMIRGIVELGAKHSDAFSWVCVEAKGIIANKTDKKDPIYDLITKEDIYKIISFIKDNKISRSTGKNIIENIVNQKSKSTDEFLKDKPEAIIKHMKEDELKNIVFNILSCNKDAVAKIKSGNIRPKDFLIGLVMKETKGKTHIGLVKSIIEKSISDMDLE